MKSKSMIAILFIFFHINTYASIIKRKMAHQVIPYNGTLHYLNFSTGKLTPISLSPGDTSNSNYLAKAEESIGVPNGSIRDAYDHAKRKSQILQRTSILCSGFFMGAAFNIENKPLKLLCGGCTLLSGYFAYRSFNDSDKLDPFFR